MGKLVKIAKLSAISLAVLAGLVLLGLSLPIGGRRAMSVQTGSMEPTVKTGSMVFVNRVPAESIAVGDVITYINPREKGETITHRVVEVLDQQGGSRQFITRGDANPLPDKPISEKHIVGKVNWSVPYIGAGRDFIYTLPGLILLVYLPALIVLISEVRRLAAFYKSQHYELPEVLLRRRASGGTGRNLAVVGVMAVMSLAVALPVRAAFQSSAALTGNTISMASEVPEPEPDGGVGSVTLRRVFIVCEEGEDEATHVQIILYNSSRTSADVGGWVVKSGDDELLTLPDDTIIPGPGLFRMRAPIIEGISYSGWNLTLFNADDEQIDESSWAINTQRECRIR